jgi:hypothetical protein
MGSGKRKRNSAPTSVKELVTVAFAEDMELAKQYKKLLNENDIPASIQTQPDDSAGFPGVAVMVPEDYLDEAHVLIESQGCFEDFFDMAFEDDRSVDFDFIDEEEDEF